MTSSFIPPAPLQTGVLFLVFNRPDTTAQVFEAIRQAKPPRLYVAADGPRERREGEVERVAKVRDIVTTVDWPCEVKTLFREKNLGCKYAVSSAINWFFEYEEQGIILEDDCLPSQSFFWYCEELLIKYATDNRVFHIDGCNFTGNQIDFNADYDFSRYALVWGWATWKRSWQFYDIDVSNIDDLRKNGVLKSYFGHKRIEKFWLQKLSQAKNGFDTWDYQWFGTVWSQNGLVIRPAVNLIKNIGFGADATHTTSDNQLFRDMRCERIDLPLKHPLIVAPNFLRDEYCSRIRFGLSVNLSEVILRKLRKFTIDF
jgi:hypothetical protein